MEGAGRDDVCSVGFRPCNPTGSRFHPAVLVLVVSVVGSFAGSAPSGHSSSVALLNLQFRSAIFLIRAFSSVTSCWSPLRAASGLLTSVRTSQPCRVVYLRRRTFPAQQRRSMHRWGSWVELGAPCNVPLPSKEYRLKSLWPLFHLCRLTFLGRLGASDADWLGAVAGGSHRFS